MIANASVHEYEEQSSELLSVEELENILGICKTHVYRLLKAPGFPAIPKPGDGRNRKSYLIPRRAFWAWFSDPKLLAEFKRLCEETDDDS